MAEPEGSYRSSAEEHEVLHCGQPVTSLEPLRGCTECRKLFTFTKQRTLLEFVGPVGVHVHWRPVGQPVAGGYRSAPASEPVEVVLERRWLARWWLPGLFAVFVSLFLTLWGSVVAGAGLGLLGGTLSISAPAAVIIGLVVLGLGGLVGYLATALLLNRTTLVVSPSHIERHNGPLAWGTSFRIERHVGDRALAVVVYENDARNLSARWPAPATHQLCLVSEGREPTMLLEQIGQAASAEAIRQVFEKLLAATDRSTSG